MAASARRPRTRILRLMPLALPTSNYRFCSIARLSDTTHACSWLCLANKGLAFVVATSVRSTHVLRTHFAYRCQPLRHRFQLESVTIYLQACHVNAEGCYSAFAPHHHAVILGFANHSVRLHTLCCRVSGLLLRLSAVISLFKSGQHRCCHTFDAPLRPTRHQMLLHMGSPCTRRASLTAMANLFSALLVGLVVIHSSNLAGIWYTWHYCTFSPASRLERGRGRFYVSLHWRLLAVPRFTLLMDFPVGCKLPFVYPQLPYMIRFVPDNWTNCLASVLSVMRFRCLDVVLCISRDRDWLRRGHPDRGTDAWSLACSRGHRGPAACVYHGSRITCRAQ